jgi:hypothetical protein
MASDKQSGQLNTAVKAIAGVIGLMIAVFSLLSIFLAPSLAQPIGTLVIGLIFTVILVWMDRLNWFTALATWLTVSIAVIVLFLIVSQPATLVGSVLDSSGAPAQGLTLILTDADGIDHKAVSDGDGAFEIRNVPEGRYTILADGDLLMSGEVPSGWKRILCHQMNMGSLVHRPSATVVVQPTPTPPAPTGTPVPTAPPPPAPTCPPVPTPVPTADGVVNTESLLGWSPSWDGESFIDVSLVLGRTDHAVRISYNLVETSFVAITHAVDPRVLDETSGISFYYSGGGASNTIEFKLILRYPDHTDDTTYGYALHQATNTLDTWALAEVPYDDLECWWPEENCQDHPRPDLTRLQRMDFAVSHKPDDGDEAGTGWVLFDDVEGIRP